MRIDIDLSENAIDDRSGVIKTRLENWLSDQNLHLGIIRSSVGGESFDEAIKGMAVLDIELETGLQYASKGQFETAAYLFAQGRRTKDFIYGRVMEGTQNPMEMLALATSSPMTIVSDFVKGMYNQRLRKLEETVGEYDQR